ncbi:concanavalin A-like lectin/glucanase [Anaeromyces robustus]|jgi:hypothetical protein|uniref:Concanavalin A-like lectin/glucanase n=1 Tax=Anaeromyces robustus TaxID=1754192 RepID=A0A1Y1XNZ3_9FUNG|nr:concanavalin A-like lectin/glucanase [Anaeromyces robustus]|eukprot:ORX87246.1 concanavalin A-like lectin/glucanase [Anaeromyces robustus]
MKSSILGAVLLASASIVSAELGVRECFLNNTPKLLGYNCCRNTCSISYKDDDGNWGIENGNWCGIPFTCYNGCWSMPDYQCCRNTRVSQYTDSAGNEWGIENNQWCGIIPQATATTRTTTKQIPSSSPSPVGDKCNWTEDFNSLDETRWNLNSGAECMKVQGGMFIDSVSQSCRGSGNGGRMRTNVRYKSGKFEVRAKMPIASGLVPAIYFASTPDNTNGSQDEWDFELIGSNRMQTNLFINGQGGREEVWNPPYDLSRDFHTYTFEWTSNSIVLKVDNQVVRTFNNPMPTQPSYFILTNWMCVGCDGWTGPADWSRQPYDFIVDYVKITDATCI